MCHVMTTDTQYVYIMCMACYDYLLILDGGDGVLTPVVDGVPTPVVLCVVCEEDTGAESLTGFVSVER